MQMDMVPFDANLLQKPIGVKFPHSPKHLLEIVGYSGNKDFSPIPCHPYQMVLGLVDHMGLSMEFHPRPS